MKDRKFRIEGKDGYTFFKTDGEVEPRLRIGDGEKIVYSDPILVYALVDRICLVNILDKSHSYILLDAEEMVLSLQMECNQWFFIHTISEKGT